MDTFWNTSHDCRHQAAGENGPSSSKARTPARLSGLSTPATSTPGSTAAPDTSAVQCYFIVDDDTDTGAPAEFLLALLSSQAADTKAVVRKGSVQLLTSFLMLLRAAAAPAELQADAMRRSRAMLQALAVDSTLTVRKAVIEAAASLAAASPLDTEVATSWAAVVFPLMQDAESSVQEQVQAEVRLYCL